MASGYEILENDVKLNEIIDNINYRLNEEINIVNKTTGVNYSLGCHGRYHAMYVVKVIEHILQALSYDKHTIELGKMAGLLHDIGCTYGKFEHAITSSYMSVEFIDKTNFILYPDKFTIFQAIQDHSNGNNIITAVGAALLIADKIDMSKNRRISVKKDLRNRGLTNEDELNKYDDRLYEIEDIDINILNNNITFNFAISGDSSILRDKFLKSKEIPIIQKASTFLKCTGGFEINGERWILL